MPDNVRPYDRQEWVKVATKWLHGTADSSMLESAYIALRIDEPELAAQLKELRELRAELERAKEQLGRLQALLSRAVGDGKQNNAVNDVLVVQPTYRAAEMITTFDNKAVDGFVNWTGTFVGDLARRLRRSQSGFARSYALSMVGGALIVAIALVLVVLS